MKIVTLLQHPESTNAGEVLLAIGQQRRFCTKVRSTLAVADTTHFRRAAWDADAATRAYLSSLAHLARYARTQSLAHLHAAQLGFLDANSRDLLAQREINACRSAVGLAAFPLQNRAYAAGIEATTI